MRRSIFRRFAKDGRGTAAVEMAIVAAPFIALLIGCIQLGVVYLSQAALELAVEKASRTVLTGQGEAQSKSQFLATVCSKLPSLLSCSNLLVDAQVYSDFASADTSTPTVSYNSDGTPKNNYNYNLGSASDIVVLRVMYLLPVVGALTFNVANSGTNRLLIATAVFRNEPYK